MPTDALAAVTIERVAIRLGLELAELHGKPAFSALDQVPEKDARMLRAWARAVIQIVDATRADCPPTYAELLTYERDRARLRAQDRIAAIGAARGHLVSVFRPDPDRPGRVLATCEACGAGATYTLVDTDLSLSEALERPCPRWTASAPSSGVRS